MLQQEQDLHREAKKEVADLLEAIKIAEDRAQQAVAEKAKIEEELQLTQEVAKEQEEEINELTTKNQMI